MTPRGAGAAGTTDGFQTARRFHDDVTAGTRRTSLKFGGLGPARADRDECVNFSTADGRPITKNYFEKET